MFGGGSNSAATKSDTPPATDPTTKSDAPPDDSKTSSSSPDGVSKLPSQAASGEKRSGNGSPSGRQNYDNGAAEKKRRSSGVGNKASNFITSAKNSLHFQSGDQQRPVRTYTSPEVGSTFRVGVWEDRNKKCRRTMEDTHAFLYNFLPTPAPLLAGDSADKTPKPQSSSDDNDAQAESTSQDMIETDNGYFAIFDGHAGTFAADWCGKKLHLVLEDIIRRNPNAPIPELLDQTFTSADAQLEKLPLKNSGCTAAIAVLRWEDRVPSLSSATGSQAIASAAAVASKAADASKLKDSKIKRYRDTATGPLHGQCGRCTHHSVPSRQGFALSYDHKGSDENEGKRIANAGGLILNNRVNGVLAVTRALGDCYMKDLVTGHPYTTETVIQPEVDEFIILACDGLWDVCSDQEAVDLIRDRPDPITASKLLVDHALARFSTDNLSCMIIRFDKAALLDQNNKDRHIGVEGDSTGESGKVSEAEKIVSSTKQKIAEGDTPAVGVSASNSGRGRDPTPIDEGDTFKPTTIKESVEEEELGSADEDDVTAPKVSAKNVTDKEAVAATTHVDAAETSSEKIL
ncbi:hypothetical protein E0Z10_g3804 [Xylaria hypoxylon]|uniref:PPM-type phosphatase domain-containing protein n=1 Tax=Xylaria hypoxylon TaxID=37992 RepID=A0A4Z0YYD6_9PEZI|nr:hypothetical protein E0Z10_g3804 [Xylaria hypoxylon]